MAENISSKNTKDSAVLVEPCGLIMPISPTANHDKPHWDAMLELLSRAVESAGYTAKPVWIDSSTDRVSERIIGNIFDHSVIIADITDLNANVMFELGLRLASKKPTLVVMEDGCNIPFDIRDFHIHVYPKNLSILGMEKFLSKLSEDIKAKKIAFDKGEYTPFLSKVVVDVVSPNEREVGMNQFVLDQLSELNRRVASMGNTVKRRSYGQDLSPDDLIVSSIGGHGAVFFATINNSNAKHFFNESQKLFDEVIDLHLGETVTCFALLDKKSTTPKDAINSKLAFEKLVDRFDGVGSVKRYISDLYRY